MGLAEGYAYYRIKLHGLREDQKQRVLEFSNVRRFVYNWGYQYVKDQYDEGKPFPKFIGLSTAFTELKKQPEYAWLRQYNVTLCRYALKDLTAAYVNFFNKQCRAPKLKTKDRDTVRFATRPDRLSFKGENGRYAYIPGLSTSRKDLIDCGNHRVPHHKGVKYADTRIKFDGIDYWLCLSVKVRQPFKEEEPHMLTGEPLGIDVGIRDSATLSNGIVFDSPDRHYLDVLENRRDKIQSAITRDQKRRLAESARTGIPYEDIPKSSNELKREEKFHKTCIRITNIYRTHYHQIASKIACMKPVWIVLESLGIRDLQANNKFVSHSINESRMATLIDYIDYKCREAGSTVIYAPSGYPSSQICSRCGMIHKSGPSKIYVCPFCGTSIDRDYNAAINLRNYGIYYLNSQVGS